MQNILYTKSKRYPKHRFIGLYELIADETTISVSVDRILTKKTVPGIDRMTTEKLKKDKEKIVKEIRQELLREKYTPSKIMNFSIPKKNGEKRELGIYTLKDRVVQQCCKIVLEPIYEAEFSDISFGYRPRRSIADALKEIRREMITSNYILDGDIKKFFDTIDRKKLIETIAQKIADKKALNLLKTIINCGQTDSSKKGISQGSIISPLLANIYLNEIDKIWMGKFQKYGKMVRYADDFVIICKKREYAEKSHTIMKKLLYTYQLSLNEDKTSIKSLEEEDLFFLGTRFRKKKHTRPGDFLPFIEIQKV